VVLAWHVDYWDRLGWKDTFADPAFTQRQKAYAKARKLRGLVTPQLFVASEPTRQWRQLPQLVAKAAEGKRVVRIEAEARLAKGKVEATVRLRDLDPAVRVVKTVAVIPVLYRLEAVTTCNAGENKGRTLTEHFPVLAAGKPLPFTKALEDKGVAARFDAPEGVEAAELGVAVLVEDSKAMRTLECTAVPVTPAK
jgi:hypothetical protein